MRKDPTEFRNRFLRWKNGENPYSAGRIVDAIYKNNPKEEFLGEPSHNYDFTQSEEWANAHGYYPDERGHRDDRVKKPAHPSHPSRGSWDRDKFVLTDKGMLDPNYTLFGLNDGGLDPLAILTHKGSTVLPEITVTPKGNYIYNSYDNIKLHLPKHANGKLPKYGDGIIPVTTGGTGMPAPLFYGGISEEARPTADTLERIANFAPYVGTILDVLEVINGNLAKTPSAVIGAVADVALPGLRTAWKGIKAAKTAVLSAPMLIDKIKNYKLLQKLQKKFTANLAYQGIGTYQDVLDDQGYIKSTKSLPKHADGKLPKYGDGKPKGDGKRYLWDDQTQSWDRYTGDAMGDTFADFVVTPRGGAHKKDIEPVLIVTPEQQQYSQRNKPTVSTNSTWHYTPAASTFAGRVVQAAGGDWKSADIASAGASLHPLLSVPLGIMDTGYNLNQSLHDLTDTNKHVNTALSAASILPLVGGLKLLKGKDVGTKLLNAYNNYMYSLGNVDDINNTLRNIKYLDSAADATPAMSNIVASPYKYTSDKSVTDLFNKMRSMLIRGKLSQIKPTQPTADDPFGIGDLALDVIHHEGMPEDVEDIFRYQILPRTNISKMNYDNTIDMLSRYGYNTLDDYNWAKYVDDNLAGYLDNSTYAIALREPYIRMAAPHEFRHRMLRLVPYKRSLAIDRESYLNRAYDDDFVNLPKNVDPNDSLYGYTLMEDEKATTNLDARLYAFSNFTDDPNIGKLPVTEQNRFLDSLTDDLIIDAVKESNGYGKRYIKFLDDKYHIYNDLKARAKYALQFRNAMKYYGAAAIPVGFGYSTVKPRQKQNTENKL